MDVLSIYEQQYTFWGRRFYFLVVQKHKQTFKTFNMDEHSTGIDIIAPISIFAHEY